MFITARPRAPPRAAVRRASHGHVTRACLHATAYGATTARLRRAAVGC
jgi:hypothetical protein